MSFIADAVAAFQKRHRRMPAEVVVTPAAAIVLVAQDTLSAWCDGVKVRVGSMPFLVETGSEKATRVVIAAGEDKLQRPNVVALEADAGPDGPSSDPK